MALIKKMSILLFFALGMFVISIPKISAATIVKECNYKYTKEDGYWLTVKVQIYDNNTSKGYLSAKGRSQNNKEDVLNWTKAHENSGFIALDYNRNNNLCPPYAIFDDKWNGWRLFLADDSNLASLNHLGYTLPLVDELNEKDLVLPEDDPRFSGGTYDFCQTDGTIKACKMIGYLVLIIKILVPLALIIFGSIDFGKAVINGAEDAIKKSTMAFMQRLIAGVVIFFLPNLILFIVRVARDFEEGYDCFSRCTRCILNVNSCDNEAEESEEN